MKRQHKSIIVGIIAALIAFAVFNFCFGPSAQQTQEIAVTEPVETVGSAVHAEDSEEAEARAAFEEKFHELAAEEDWNTEELQAEFLDTVDLYADLAVENGAVPSKAEFYRQYVSREYSYPDEYAAKLKERYLNSGASSIISESAVANAFDTYGTVGRAEAGNFVTSYEEDAELCYDNGKLRSAEEIAILKGKDRPAFSDGVFQYSYSAELVQSCEKQGLLRTVDGTTPGASSLNIPGAVVWNGADVEHSETEMMMPSIVIRDYTSEEVFSQIAEQEYFEIKNPTVLAPDGSEVTVEGSFFVLEMVD